jgi:hypothetical protein
MAEAIHCACKTLLGCFAVPVRRSGCIPVLQKQFSKTVHGGCTPQAGRPSGTNAARWQNPAARRSRFAELAQMSHRPDMTTLGRPFVPDNRSCRVFRDADAVFK